VVARGAGLDDLARDQVGVDDGEGVGWFGEEGGYGGFAGCNGAGEAEKEHCGGWVGVGAVCGWGNGVCVGRCLHGGVGDGMTFAGSWNLYLGGGAWTVQGSEELERDCGSRKSATQHFTLKCTNR
jgi:hypothetical protein